MSDSPDRMYWGAGWVDSERYARVWSRGGSAPSQRSSFIGFRLAVDTEADRVSRGGSWNLSARFARVAGRYRDDPTNRSINLGFRLARDGECI